MRILVTGGAGFLGKATANALAAEEHEVIVVDDLSSGKAGGLDPRIDFIQCDIRNPKGYPKKIDAVYHFAAKIDIRDAVLNPAETLSVNVTGTAQLIQYAQQAGSRHFIFASSGGTIYGDTPLACTIRTPENPHCPYSLSKYAGEQLLMQYARFCAFPYTILRYSNVYGPGQDGSKETGVIAIFSQRANEGLPLTVYGGNQVRDFIHIDDVITANLEALNHRGIFNISTGVGTSIREIATRFSDRNQTKITWEDSQVGEISNSCLVPSKMGGWEPRIALSEGLKTI